MKDLLRLPPFRRLLGGWSVANLADSVLYLTLAIWAKDLTGSSSAAGLVFLALAAPVLLAPVVGLIADRLSRKWLLVAGNLAGAGVTLALLGVSTASDIWLLYLVTFGYGTLGYLNGAAQTGLVRDMVAADLLGEANSLLVTIDQGLRILTPVLGAALYVMWGGHALALAVAGTLVVGSALLALVRVQESPRGDEQGDGGGDSGWRAITAGLHHLRRIPLLVRMVVTSAIAFGVIGFLDTAIFELIEHGLQRDASFFGVFASIQGAGSVVGGITAGRVLRRLGPARCQGLGLGLLAVACCSLTAAGLGIPLLPVVVLAAFVAGLGIPWMVVALITTRQRLTPPRLQGRVSAATNVATTVPQLASIATGAALVLVLDYRLLIGGAGVVVLCCALSLLSPRVPAMPPAAGSTPAAPQPAVPE